MWIGANCRPPPGKMPPSQEYINFGLYMYMLLLYPREQSVSRKIPPPKEKFMYQTLMLCATLFPSRKMYSRYTNIPK